MNLFAALYLDEDVSALVDTLLRARGFDSTTVRNEGMLALDDSVQLTHAVSLRRAIVTHNRVDFELLHHAYIEAQKPHFGII